MLALRNPKPLYCVFEITLACNARCRHCGSSAGEPRQRELDTEEALDLLSALSRLGCQKVTLSGGEPLLRDDWPEIARGILTHGMRAELITNGIEALRQANLIAEAGFSSVSFSIDGTGPTHDYLRGMEGCLDLLLRGAREIRRRGVKIGAVTQINKKNINYLNDIHDLLVSEEFAGWQVQLTTPNGRAKTEPDLCLKPEDLPDLETRLLALALRNEIFLQAADTIGYMSKGEPRLRAGTATADKFWGSCQAGLRLVGITSDGSVKGCLSMPSSFTEGNIRDRSFEDIWMDPNAFSYNRHFSRDDLEFDCGECAFGNLCRGGCTNLAHASTGTVTHNLYCIRRFSGSRSKTT